MKRSKGPALVVAMGLLAAACTPIQDKTVDHGFDSHDLSDMKAGIWVDPNGCDHWIIDDGLEGYLSERMDKNGKPVCSGVAQPGYATGPFKKNSTIADSL